LLFLALAAPGTPAAASSTAPAPGTYFPLFSVFLTRIPFYNFLGSAGFAFAVQQPILLIIDFKNNLMFNLINLFSLK